MTTDDAEALRALGLAEDELGAYLLLVLGGEGAVEGIAQRLGRPVSETAGVLERLVLLGLALPDVSGTGFAAAPVTPALDALSRRRREELSAAESFAHQLAARAADVVERRSPQHMVSVVVGSAAIRAIHEQMQRSAAHELLVLDRPPYVTEIAEGGVGVDPVQQERMAVGVRYRTIYDAALLDSPPRMARIRAEIDAGEDGRVMSDLPLKLVVCDRSLAMLPLIDSGDVDEPAALVVRPSVLLDSLVALFDALWSVARPMVPSNQAGGDDARQIVELLAAGMTEERLARLLGISARTVRRRLADAREELGAETMFQAGAEAVRRDWI